MDRPAKRGRPAARGGADGAARSSEASAGSAAPAGLATSSRNRNSTSVVPSAAMSAAAPALGCDQFTPVSSPCGAQTCRTRAEAAFSHAGEPPVTTGSGGRVTSTAAVARETLTSTTLSGARNWPIVVPSALAPAVAGRQWVRFSSPPRELRGRGPRRSAGVRRFWRGGRARERPRSYAQKLETHTRRKKN